MPLAGAGKLYKFWKDIFEMKGMSPSRAPVSGKCAGCSGDESE